MVKYSLTELELEIIELKKSHQNQVKDVRRKNNDFKEAFKTVSKKFEKVESNPAVKAAVEILFYTVNCINLRSPDPKVFFPSFKTLDLANSTYASKFRKSKIYKGKSAAESNRVKCINHKLIIEYMVK